MVRPVPEGSLTDHDNLTVAWAPIVTALGDAENAFMVGVGHGFAVTVVVVEDWPPQPAVAIS